MKPPVFLNIPDVRKGIRLDLLPSSRVERAALAGEWGFARRQGKSDYRFKNPCCHSCQVLSLRTEIAFLSVFSCAMPIAIELPDLLAKLKVITYGHYQVERQQQDVFITLFTHQNTTRYRLVDPLSADKQVELANLLHQYRS